jgi:hypothetical protein
MTQYYFYSKIDKNQEPVMNTRAWSRLEAAKHFAAVKQMDLKVFLSVFSVSR